MNKDYNLKEEELERLMTIISFQAESYEKKQQEVLAMDSLKLLDFYKDLKIENDTYGNIYVTKGEADLYPCAIAHLDQVHDFHFDYKVVRIEDDIFAFSGTTQKGTGGDDKCGVFLCIEMLQKFPCVKVVFFMDEEVGCRGSSAAHIPFFEDCSFILQGDRNHRHDDFITRTNGYTIASQDFITEAEKYYKGYGYDLAIGSMTDVGQIIPDGAGCSGANVACGYMNAHMDNETINIPKLAKCLRLFEDIFTNMSDKRWAHKVDRNYYKRGTRYGSYSWNDDAYGYGRGAGYGGRSSNTYNSYDEDYWEDEKDEYNLFELFDEDNKSDKSCTNCGSEDTYAQDDFFSCQTCHRAENPITGFVVYEGDTIKKDEELDETLVDSYNRI